MSHEEVIAMVRENERMKAALQSFKAYVEAALVCGWRQKIYDVVLIGLGRPQ